MNKDSKKLVGKSRSGSTVIGEKEIKAWGKKEGYIFFIFADDGKQKVPWGWEIGTLKNCIKEWKAKRDHTGPWAYQKAVFELKKQGKNKDYLSIQGISESNTFCRKEK